MGRYRSRNSGSIEAIGYILMGIFVVLMVLGSFVYRGLTLETSTITPTSYHMTKDDGSVTREVFAKDGEYRMKDTWFIPHNRDTGKWANIVEQAVTKNKASLVRNGDYNTTCDIKTWGMRFSLLSMYPTIYEVNCK